MTTAQVFVGNGSDEVLAHIFHALFQHGKPVLMPDISYNFYSCNHGGLYGIEAKALPLAEDFSIRPGKGENGGIIFPNPNAPTGMLLPLAGIEQILQANPSRWWWWMKLISISVVKPPLLWSTAIPSLLVIRALSKSRSLAGLRVGLAVGHADLIEALERIKNSFNSYPLDRLAIVGAVYDFEIRLLSEPMVGGDRSRERVGVGRARLPRAAINDRFILSAACRGCGEEESSSAPT